MHRAAGGRREDPHSPRQARCLGGDFLAAALPGTATGEFVRLNQALGHPPQAAMPSAAAAVAFGPKRGIVKKLAELPDFYRPERRDSGRYCTEARVGDCWMTWAYSIGFRERVFIRPILWLNLPESDHERV